ncbi:MAG: four helix bundle protein [Ignavibacteriales bacterium]|nr:four helix bundle protein [Ignavibacteriales bacterium]
MRDFRKLTIWQQGIQHVKEVYLLSGLLPKEEKYGLKSQMCRAAVSIPSNIAEGCSRNSDIEFRRYLEMAIGSTFELETQLILLKEIGFTHEENLIDVFALLSSEQKMINALITKISNSQKLTTKS